MPAFTLRRVVCRSCKAKAARRPSSCITENARRVQKLLSEVFPLAAIVAEPAQVLQGLQNFPPKESVQARKPHRFKLASVERCAGVEPEEMREQMRHRSLSTTRDVYSHLAEDEAAMAAETEGDAVNDALKEIESKE